MARYLTAVGIDIGADRLNDLLALLAVMMIEAGGGLSLAVGMALSASPAACPSAASTTSAGPPQPRSVIFAATLHKALATSKAIVLSAS